MMRRFDLLLQILITHWLSGSNHRQTMHYWSIDFVFDLATFSILLQFIKQQSGAETHSLDGLCLECGTYTNRMHGSQGIFTASVHLYCESVHLYCESLHLYCESVHLYCESIHLYCESVHIYCESVHFSVSQSTFTVSQSIFTVSQYILV